MILCIPKFYHLRKSNILANRSRWIIFRVTIKGTPMTTMYVTFIFLHTKFFWGRTGVQWHRIRSTLCSPYSPWHRKSIIIIPLIGVPRQDTSQIGWWRDDMMQIRISWVYSSTFLTNFHCATLSCRRLRNHREDGSTTLEDRTDDSVSIFIMQSPTNHKWTLNTLWLMSSTSEFDIDTDAPLTHKFISCIKTCFFLFTTFWRFSGLDIYRIIG